MKLKTGLVLREVAGQFVIVPTGKRVREVLNTVYISSSAAYLWEHMQENFTKEELVDLILQRYIGVTREIAEADITSFLETLRKNNILEPEASDSQSGSVCVRIKNDF